MTTVEQAKQDKFVGIQISPISFIDEGVEEVLETLQTRIGVNVLLIGTVSWLGLKSGRSISHDLDGFPDHGVPEPFAYERRSLLQAESCVLYQHYHQRLLRLPTPRWRVKISSSWSSLPPEPEA